MKQGGRSVSQEAGMRFRAVVSPSGNATGVEVPAEVAGAMGPEARPPVSVTINGYTWRSRIARMRGQILIGISAAQRAGAGIAEGDEIEVELSRDDAPREVELPDDLAEALDDAARAAFDKLPFGLKRKHVADIEAAKSAETRQRRIAKLVGELSTGSR